MKFTPLAVAAATAGLASAQFVMSVFSHLPSLNVELTDLQQHQWDHNLHR
jgi:hypothetical protein